MKYLKKLEKWFFAFWVVRSRITYLLAIVIAIYGFIALNSIPKESSPQVNLPIVSVTTRYDWVSAVIMDSEVTEKLEDSLEDIDSIASYTSSSSEWNSRIRITIKDWFDIDDSVDEIENAIDSVNLPSAIDDDYPIVSQLNINSTDMFSILLYWKDEDYSFENLLDLAAQLQSSTQWNAWIKEVTIDTNTSYDIRLIFSKATLDNLWLSLSNISSAINNNNIDSPIGSYELDWTNYSYTLVWKIKTVNELLKTNIQIWNSKTPLSSLAELELYYGEERINKYWSLNDVWYNYISLTYSKLAWANIFDVSDNAKAIIEWELEKDIYSWLDFKYTEDEAKEVVEWFSELSMSAIQTLVLVFLALIFFVWVRESTIATFILPLAFFLGFIVVNYIWETFNNITTFAFVLAFGIAIDTIIIIIEWSSEKVRQWYNPRTAVLIALKEYKSPIIIGTLTTISAFIPILTLPGFYWIFLSFIPLVVFIILVSTLFVALTIAGPLFILFSKSKNKYEVFEEREKVMTKEEKELLESERLWKTKQNEDNINLKEKIFHKYSSWYKKALEKIISRKRNRVISILTPIILLFVCIFTLIWSLGFEIFPQWARDQISLNLSGPQWLQPADLNDQIDFIENLYAKTEEIDFFTLSISWNRISSNIYLIPAIERQQLWQRENTILQTQLNNEINEAFWSEWFTAWSRWGRRWPPGWADPVWIQIIASNANLYDSIVELSSNFEDYLWTIEEVSNITVSAPNPVAWIEFSVNQDQADLLWISEREIFTAVSNAIRWQQSISITWASDDNDVELYIREFMDNLSPSDIEDINIYVWGKIIKAWSVLDYTITKTSPTITRADGNIQVAITASVISWEFTTEVQQKLIQFATEYDFPIWISYKAAWENEQNSELIWSVIQWIFIAFFFIFAILVYQFNSYGQPLAILYSVFMSLSWVIFWLYVTGNPLSMPVWIWFISLMWIVVNDAIVLVDKINKNIHKWMELSTAIVEWSVSRLNPVLVTTITTVAWILPIALQDVFWAWLWFTVAFGLTTGSLLTLFVIPTLYYSLEARKYKKSNS
jgi:multidrug efflux pump subunit AcrB